jgi:diguanylate cyclase (GGDEF)-like protein
MTTLLNDVINSFEQAVLEVLDQDSDTFILAEGDSLWIKDIFPRSLNKQPFVISDDVPFLQDFLIDAKKIWSNQANGRLKSGYWTEITANHSELHLEATAIKQRNKNLLVVSNQSEEFNLRQLTMQSAREQSLYNDQLLDQNEYLHTRLLDILKKPTKQNDILNALTETIEKARFAVIIANINLTTIISNSAVNILFEQNNSTSNQSKKPIDIIIQLLKSQLPEYERIILTKSSWEGEICWMSPPATLKWLKIALHPVRNEFNEIQNWIIFANDITNIKHLVQRNEQLAFQDMLTELPNRLCFWQALQKQVLSQEPFYLLYIDINEFRRHNEFYGHEEGDKLLIDFAGRLNKTIKECDFIARVGGDEFAIILTNVNNQQDCKQIVQRIFNCTQIPFITGKSSRFNLSVSVGAANFPLDAQSAEELLKFVDLSTYNGKHNSKSSLQFYSQKIKDASHRLIEMEHDLKLAIVNEEFELFLQPIINLKESSIVKAEALIRWHHPTKGMISPQDFIPVAEQSQLIITIGKWVISKSCQIAQKIAKKGHKVKITMNLSPSQVLDKELFSYLHSCIKEYNVDPSLLGLEVTEGILVDDYAKVETLLNKARGLGLSVSVDDFGTGYSSLSHLKKLPLDFLKIDRTFVKDIVNDDNDQAIVKAVISMAHNLNLGVIAEGVETQEQLNFLLENSCDSVQGFLFSRPVDFDSFTKILDQKSLF